MEPGATVDDIEAVLAAHVTRAGAGEAEHAAVWRPDDGYRGAAVLLTRTGQRLARRQTARPSVGK